MTKLFRLRLSPHMSTHARAVTRAARLVFALALACFAPASSVRAAPQNQAAPTIVTPASARVSSVARELVCDCPDCGKQALDQCPNCEIGRKYRAVIASQLKQGRSKAQIVEYFGNTYGEHILGTPRQQGFGRTAFTLPALAVLMGLLPLSVVLRRRKRDARNAPVDVRRNDASSENASPKMAEDPRVEAALRDYDF